MEKYQELREEIAKASKINKEKLQPKFKEFLDRYLGKYIPNFTGSMEIILNEIYPIVDWMLPSIFFKNPKAFLKARNKTFIANKFDPNIGEKVAMQLDSNKSAKTQEGILNYALHDIKYKKEAKMVTRDGLIYNYGVLWHGYKGDFGISDEGSIYIKKDNIFARRLDPQKFIFDPYVNICRMEEARWQGRILDLRRSEVEDNPQYKISKKKSRNKDAERIQSEIDVQSSRKDKKDCDKFIRLYEIYLKPTFKEASKGKKGKILVFSNEQVEPLRESEWEIEAEGFPGKVLYFNEVNDDRYPLADIDVYSPIADQKNIITNIQLENAQENTKQLVGYNKELIDEEELGRAIEGDNNYIGFDGDRDIRTQITAINTGGAVSQELYMVDAKIQQNLDEKSGVSDLRKGVLKSGEESATSVRVRTAGSSTRISNRQDIMADFLKESFEYLLGLIKQFMPYKEAVRIMGTTDIEWTEDFEKEDIQAPVDVDVDVTSMLPEDPATEMQQFSASMALLTNMLTNPILSGKLVQEGKKINLSPLIEQILYRSKITVPGVFENIELKDQMGYASIEQIGEAQQNVMAALSGAEEVPYPPKEGDDLKAKLQFYGFIAQMFQQSGQISPVLVDLIRQTEAMLKAQEAKNAKPGQVMEQ